MTLENLKKAKEIWDREADDESLSPEKRERAKEFAKITAERIIKKGGTIKSPVNKEAKKHDKK